MPVPKEWGLVVPSQEQRSKVLSLKSQKNLSGDGNNEIYTAIGMVGYSIVVFEVMMTTVYSGLLHGQ